MKPYENKISDVSRRTRAGMVSCLDYEIGRIITQLKDSGEWKNTLVIFSTDNGGEVVGDAGNNWPLRGSKHTLYEGGVHGVGLVNGGYLPDHQRGKISNGTTETLNFIEFLIMRAERQEEKV